MKEIEMLIKENNICFIDIEATGLNPMLHSIITLAAIKNDKELYLTFTPDGRWEKDAERVHKISMSQAMAHDDKIESMKKFIEFAQGSILACYANRNTELGVYSYDTAFIKSFFFHNSKDYFSYFRYFPLQLSVHDMANDPIARIVLGDDRKRGLAEVSKRLGITLDHHDARSDARACMAIFNQLKSIVDWKQYVRTT